MNRRALLIGCNESPSGKLSGIDYDLNKYDHFLNSNLGGNWYEWEVKKILNPTLNDLESIIESHYYNSDYTFTLFSGHGCVNRNNFIQYLELMNGDIQFTKLKSKALKQTIIIDACRGYETIAESALLKSVLETKDFSDITPTRKIFDNAIEASENGLTVLYSASKNESSAAGEYGSPYLLSLLIANNWKRSNSSDNILKLDSIHYDSESYLREFFPKTLQTPFIEPEKRRNYFPFAVKPIRLFD